MKKVTTKIYLMIDSHGNKASVTVEESCDNAQVCGMLNKEGEKVYFESDAYHIPTFCNDNDIQLKVIDRSEDFDSLWGSFTEKQELEFNVNGTKVTGKYLSMIAENVIQIEVTFDESEVTEVGCSANVHQSFLVL